MNIIQKLLPISLSRDEYWKIVNDVVKEINKYDEFKEIQDDGDVRILLEHKTKPVKYWIAPEIKNSKATEIKVFVCYKVTFDSSQIHMISYNRTYKFGWETNTVDIIDFINNDLEHGLEHIQRDNRYK